MRLPQLLVAELIAPDFIQAHNWSVAIIDDAQIFEEDGQRLVSALNTLGVSKIQVMLTEQIIDQADHADTSYEFSEIDVNAVQIEAIQQDDLRQFSVLEHCYLTPI